MIIPDSKRMASIIVARLNPKKGEMDMKKDEMPEDGEKEMDADKEGLKAIAEELLEAIEKKDAHALAVALHDFFEMSDSMPHKEGPHEDEDESSEDGMIPSLLK